LYLNIELILPPPQKESAKINRQIRIIGVSISISDRLEMGEEEEVASSSNLTLYWKTKQK